MDLSDIKRNKELLVGSLGLEKYRPGKLNRCPFHDDSTPSLSIFKHDGIWFWKCHAGCGSGTIIDAAMQDSSVTTPGQAIRYIEREMGVKIDRDEEPVEPVIDEERAERLITVAHRTLMDSFSLQEKYMLGKRGIHDLSIIERYRIGFKERLTFDGWGSWWFHGWVLPVTNARGTLIGVKIHSERKNSEKSPKAFWAPFGTYPRDKPKNGLATLWPPPERFGEGQVIYLCPGELKAVAMLSDGMLATSVTAGEGSSKFHSSMVRRLQRLKPEKIVLTYDNDQAGRKFAGLVGTALEDALIPVTAIEFDSEVEPEPVVVQPSVPLREPTLQETAAINYEYKKQFRKHFP